MNVELSKEEIDLIREAFSWMDHEGFIHGDSAVVANAIFKKLDAGVGGVEYNE